LTEQLTHQGIRTCSWQEFTEIVEEKPFRAQALIVLAQAPTVRTAHTLLDQYDGAFQAAVQAILAAWRAGAGEEAARRLGELAGFCMIGRHLTTPWRVVIAGAPNVGKSSLLNALAGYTRAIVSAIPGTTRDLVTVRLAMEGWPVEFTDTAGLHAAGGSLEREGIELARRAAAEADLCLWVLDASTHPVWPDFRSESLHVIVNKADLTNAWDPAIGGDAPRVSALTGEGLEQLCRKISGWLVPKVPPRGAAVPFTSTLCNGVEEAWKHYLDGRRDAARACLDELCQRGEAHATREGPTG
jgi:tRNA modification GTPase